MRTKLTVDPFEFFFRQSRTDCRDRIKSTTSSFTSFHVNANQEFLKVRSLYINKTTQNNEVKIRNETVDILFLNCNEIRLDNEIKRI